MATRPNSQPPNRQGNYSGSGSSGNSVDVGTVSVTRMAREDARWYVVAVVVLSLVLFLALPISVLVYIDTLKLQAEIRYEIKRLKHEKALVDNAVAGGVR